MVCGMFSSEGVGPLLRLDGTINATVYRNLLEQHIIPSVRAASIQLAIFIHDNTSCHTAKRVKDYLQQENIPVMKWPAQSLDLNPIENI